MKHRIEIDGLRAFAIIPVLIFHAGFSWMPGGFLGVDIFFVISGFLITGIIVGELHAKNRFSIIRFYERRARRIMPALFVVVMATFALSWFVLFPSQMSTLSHSVISIIYFGSNYFFLNQTGYFDPNIDLNPMLHTWSLAIEEQFYVFFPLIVWALWKWVKEKFWIPILVIVGLLSLYMAQVHWYLDSSSTFYLLQYRAWELIAGAVAAIYLSHRGERRISNVFSAVGLITIVVSVFTIGTSLPHPGLITLIPVLGTVLILLFAGEGTLSHRVLTWKPFVWVGLISYSAYLWHQPLFALFRISSIHEPSPLAFLPLIGVTLVLSYLSWRFVENPFRDRKRVKRGAIFIGTLIVALVLGGTSYAMTRSKVNFNRTSLAGVKFVELESRVDNNRGLSEYCVEFAPDSTECRTMPLPSVLLWGDSYAMHLALAMKYSTNAPGMVQQTLSACAPIVGIAHQENGYGLSKGEECIKFNDSVLSWLREQQSIQYVVLASPWSSTLWPTADSLLRSGEVVTNGDRALNALRETINAIEAMGKKVVVVNPTPTSGHDYGQCLIRSAANGSDLSACDFPLSTNTRVEVNALVEKVSDIAGVWSWDPVLCPDGTCLVSRDGVFIYRDAGHISIEGSQYLGENFDIMGQLIRAADNG